MTEIDNIIKKEVIGVNLPYKTKKDAIVYLSTLLFENNYITNIEEFVEDVYYRESLGTTGIGNYIAIPHGKSDVALKNGIAIGIFNNEIPWESLDNNGAKIICLFVVKNENKGAEDHLKLLSIVAGKLGNDDTVRQLLEAKTKNEVILAFK